MNVYFKIKLENMNNKYGLSFEFWIEKGVGEDERGIVKDIYSVLNINLYYFLYWIIFFFLRVNIMLFLILVIICILLFVKIVYIGVYCLLFYSCCVR